MLKINGSAVGNHPHPPLFCTAAADRLIQLFTPVFIRQMVLSKKTHSCSLIYTHINKCIQYITMIHVQFHPCSNTQDMWTGPNRLCYLKTVCQVFTMKEADTLWKQPSLKSISSCCFPRHFHYPPLCCRSHVLLSAYPHFVSIIHSGLAFWHACKLANYRMVSCH